MKSLKRSQTSSKSTSPSSSSSNTSSSSPSSSWIYLRSVLFVVASSSPASCSSSSTHRGHLKSPWSRRKRKHILSSRHWRNLFTSDGKLRDGGVKFLKKVRSGGVDPSIKAEVWPFLLGVYDLSSSKEERDIIKTRKIKEYEKLRRKCLRLLKHNNDFFKLNETGEASNGDSGGLVEGIGSPNSDDVVSARESLSSEERFPYDEDSDRPTNTMMDGCAGSKRVTDSNVIAFSDSSYSDSSEDPDASQTFNFTENGSENDRDILSMEDSSPSKMEVQSEPRSAEDFATWQRIIRLDAVRASGEWIAYSPVQATVSEGKAHHSAEVVGLKDYDHLEPCRIFHAARLVAILEAYALYDPEIGYCQGMSDLLSPIITVMTEDHEAFWCFVGFMKKARHNFRLDEEGIRRQLNIVSKIIKFKDSHLFRHLEKLQAEDCFFVYRMVVVLFRRELTFEQTLCLWEIMWADQAAIRAGIGKSAWSRIRQRAPPTDDLLLYAIAASVLQRRKQIIEKYNSMDDILRECNAMAGHLDVWKLLDDAHNLVVTLHDKIETPL
ncbi:small G protein signaling modulator 1-like isoform X2 [Olea europaea var. sylvestris]|uniref:Small G signaling modulator 2-like n=1 Tax=Olea europaea subsp. europaea TaxID=158383 RepID=A0A8S0QZN1_OLEEU|nr:small G protein signaling modulator 1-like isoform X2 [Olea europaea var. sylvestris]CAA2971247.1 small G signaling modulator 2-like [Olea europaea subsp. europaea]